MARAASVMPAMMSRDSQLRSYGRKLPNSGSCRAGAGADSGGAGATSALIEAGAGMRRSPAWWQGFAFAGSAASAGPGEVGVPPAWSGHAVREGSGHEQLFVFASVATVPGTYVERLDREPRSAGAQPQERHRPTPP